MGVDEQDHGKKKAGRCWRASHEGQQRSSCQRGRERAKMALWCAWQPAEEFFPSGLSGLPHVSEKSELALLQELGETQFSSLHAH